LGLQRLYANSITGRERICGFRKRGRENLKFPAWPFSDVVLLIFGEDLPSPLGSRSTPVLLGCLYLRGSRGVELQECRGNRKRRGSEKSCPHAWELRDSILEIRLSLRPFRKKISWVWDSSSARPFFGFFVSSHRESESFGSVFKKRGGDSILKNKRTGGNWGKNGPAPTPSYPREDLLTRNWCTH